MLYCRKISMLFVMLVLTCAASACILDLTPEGLVLGSRFGVCVSANSRIMMVSAPYESFGGYTEAGAVYIYEKDGDGLWQYVHRLQSPSIGAFNYFGRYIDIDQNSDSIVICETGNGNGRVYLYSKDALSDWNNLTPVIFAGPTSGENFAQVAKIHGDTVVVGAPRAIVNGNIEGVVYIYNKVNGTWITNPDQRLTHANSGILNQNVAVPNFGYSISLSDELLVAGAYTHSTANPLHDNAGSACVYRKGASGWGSGVMLTSLVLTDYEKFGYSVAVSGSGTVAVGTYAPAFALDSGKVYIFTYEGNLWRLGRTITPPSSEGSRRFGWGIVCSGNDLYIEDGWSPVSVSSGTIYRYNYDGTNWNYADTFTSSDNSFATVGSGMAVSDGYLFAADYNAQSNTGMINEVLLDPDYMADFDDDCDFDVDDITVLASSWLTDDMLLDIAPDGGDGIVNMLDLVKMGKVWKLIDNE